jgi:type I restriction enzyme, S subunit
VRKGWPTKTLGEVCQFRGGGTPSKAVEHYWCGDIPWVSPKDMKFDMVSDSVDHISEQAINNSATSLIAKGSVLIVVRSGILARTVPIAIAGRDLTINQDLKALCPNGTIEARFLYYLLNSKMKLLLSMVSRGATVHRLMTESIRSINFVLPPPSEQQRIVGILDEAFSGIVIAKANAEKNLQNARALFESRLQSVFTQRGPGWLEKKLSEVCAITSTLVDPRKKNFLDLVHVGAGNIESKTGAFVELKTAREEGLISGKFLFDESMVLYSKIRPYLMKVARPEFRGLCSADIYPLAPMLNQITRDYLFYLLLSKGFTEYAIQGSARAGMPKVNREHLFEFRVWLPSIKEQTRLAGTLDDLAAETQCLESIYEHKLGALEALKKSLLNQAFTGELSAPPEQLLEEGAA